MGVNLDPETVMPDGGQWAGKNKVAAPKTRVWGRFQEPWRTLNYFGDQLNWPCFQLASHINARPAGPKHPNLSLLPVGNPLISPVCYGQSWVSIFRGWYCPLYNGIPCEILWNDHTHPYPINPIEFAAAEVFGDANLGFAPLGPGSERVNPIATDRYHAFKKSVVQTIII